MKEKIRVIIDTDTANEIDDQFALAYALANKDLLDIEAITLEPFVVGYKHISPADSLIESKNETNRILRLMGLKNPKLVYKGCDDFFTNGYCQENAAVKKIISVAKKGKVTILALGVLANVAVALSLAPEIADNINVVWLGTKHIYHETFDDSNYRKDKDAFEFVIKSRAEMTVIPSYIGKFIVTSTYELEKSIAVNDIGRYLLRIAKSYNFENQEAGVKTIYDVAPVAYLLHPEMFEARTIPANDLLKEQKKTLMSRRVNYVFDMAPNNVVWQDFVKKISKIKNTITPPQTFFTSNTYFGDANQIRTRLTPYKTVEEMDEDLINRWNSVVGKKDIVYHIGDFGKYRYVKKLNGKIHLICGNHEKWVYGRDFEGFKQKLLDMGFASVEKLGTYIDKDVLGEKVYLTYKTKNCKKSCNNLYGQHHAIGGTIENGYNVSALFNDFTPLSAKQVKANLQFINDNKKAKAESK